MTLKLFLLKKTVIKFDIIGCSQIDVLSKLRIEVEIVTVIKTV